MEDMQLTETSFSGHESFPLRYAWLKKGYDHLVGDPEFFGREDAMVALGVGKNMVRSIRHWGLVLRMWEDEGSSRGRRLVPTELGRALLSDGGWDPFLEDEGTIWWLHHLAATNPSGATGFAWAFARPRGFGELRKDGLVAELASFEERREVRRTSVATIKRDVDVLARSYTSLAKAAAHEDVLECPFVQLGLMSHGSERGSFSLLRGSRPTLPLWAFEASLCDYVLGEFSGLSVSARPGHASARRLSSVGLDDLCYAPGAPGRVFALTERALLDRVVGLSESDPESYAFDDTAGVRQVLLLSPAKRPSDVIASHFGAPSVIAIPRD